MPELPGHERRKARRHHRRLVRSGGEFTSEELDAGDVELEEVEPSGTEPEDGGNEAWAWGDKPMSGKVRERLEAYRAFVREHRQPGDDTDA